MATGIFGMVCGVLVLLLVKEPKRGAFDKVQSLECMSEEELDSTSDATKEDSKIQIEAPVKVNPFTQFVDSLKAVMQNPVSRWTTLAGMFRYWETFSVIYFIPSFFMRVYPDQKVVFGFYYALIMACCGFISSISCGLLSDKYEKKSRLTKSIICMAGSAIGIPAIMGCTLVTNNFYWCLACIALKYTVSEGWLSPSITMMQRTVKPSEQGSIVSGFLFYLVVIGCISTVVLGKMSNLLGAAADPTITGKLICAWSLMGYLCAIPCY